MFMSISDTFRLAQSDDILLHNLMIETAAVMLVYCTANHDLLFKGQLTIIRHN